MKTRDSESLGQEKAVRMWQMSKSFTGSIALKLVDVLNKPLWKLLSQDSAHSDYTESVNQ